MKKPAFQLSRVGIIGTGVMGRQLARFFLMHKFSVTLKTRKHRLGQIQKLFADYLKPDYSPTQIRHLPRRLKITSNWKLLSACDLVIECGPENITNKKQILKNIEKYVSAKAIIGSNTSSFSIDKLAQKFKHPQRFLGIHFFNPVSKLNLVEVIPNVHTTDAVVETIVKLLNSLGKYPLVVADAPGFIVNRLLFTFINEAAYLHEDKSISTYEIDTAVKYGLSHPLGPFEIADLVGLNTTYAIINNLYKQGIGRKPAPTFKKLLRNNKAGKASGAGFYTYKA